MEQRNELRVKYLQCHIQWEDEQANLQHYTSLIESSIGECDLFVLPEMFHCGFTEHPERHLMVLWLQNWPEGGLWKMR